MNILFFGDVMGKIGRKAINKIVPSWKKKYKQDIIIANGENLAHGVGITEKTVREIFDSGVDFLTGGNHIFDKDADAPAMWDTAMFGKKMVRPANFLMEKPGNGAMEIETKKGKLMVVNLLGRVFFKEEYKDPFLAIDEILKSKSSDVNCVLLDFHAEATSEKVALGWYLDGRVSAIVGTHTHIPTCDARVLPAGTAYITDVGMVGAKDSVLGEDKETIIKSFLSGKGFKHSIAEDGEAIVQAVLIKVDDKTGKAKSIERLEEIVKV